MEQWVWEKLQQANTFKSYFQTAFFLMAIGAGILLR
jgi:DNA-binding MltR family transcriptional regulator